MNLVNVNILNGKLPKTIIVTNTPSLTSSSSSSSALSGSKTSSIDTPNNHDQMSLLSSSSTGTTTVVATTINKGTLSMNEEAPPIPPRSNKMMINDINRPQKSSITASKTPSISKNNSIETNDAVITTNNQQQEPYESRDLNLKINPNIVSLLPSSTHHQQNINSKDEKLQLQDDSDDESNPICGPAETISGIIDTRPIEQRTNYVSFASLTNNLTTNFNLITVSGTTADNTANNKEQALNKEDNNKISNTYLLRSNQMNNNNINNHNNLSNVMNGTGATTATTTTTSSVNNHQRHMSVPVFGTPQKTLPTSPSTFQASISQMKMPNNSLSSPMKSGSSPQCANILTTSTAAANIKISNNQKLYENIKMKSAGNLISLNNLNNNSNSSSSSNNVNVSYENINLEYINRLMKEGYSKENVMAALCISRNNFEMACDILHEFVSTDSQTQSSKVFESNR